MAQIQVALMLLTRLPAGRLGAYVPSMGQSAWAFALVGGIVGGLAAILLTALAGMPPILAAGITVAVQIVITGGLHEDGLADLADGFGGGQTRARKLEIMRDSRIGSYGTLALIMALGLRVQALALVIPIGHAALALIAIECASRAALPLMLRVLPPARSDGLGHGAAGVSWAAAAAALVMGAGALLLLGWGAAMMVAAAMAAVIAVVAALALRQIGGQTGDVLGAMQQLAAVAGWLVLAA